MLSFFSPFNSFPRHADPHGFSPNGLSDPAEQDQDTSQTPPSELTKLCSTQVMLEMEDYTAPPPPPPVTPTPRERRGGRGDKRGGAAKGTGGSGGGSSGGGGGGGGGGIGGGGGGGGAAAAAAAAAAGGGSGGVATGGSLRDEGSCPYSGPQRRNYSPSRQGAVRTTSSQSSAPPPPPSSVGAPPPTQSGPVGSPCAPPPPRGRGSPAGTQSPKLKRDGAVKSPSRPSPPPALLSANQVLAQKGGARTQHTMRAKGPGKRERSPSLDGGSRGMTARGRRRGTLARRQPYSASDWGSGGESDEERALLSSPSHVDSTKVTPTQVGAALPASSVLLPPHNSLSDTKDPIVVSKPLPTFLCVFSTQLINKAAEAVKLGQSDSILSFHQQNATSSCKIQRHTTSRSWSLTQQTTSLPEDQTEAAEAPSLDTSVGREAEGPATGETRPPSVGIAQTEGSNPETSSEGGETSNVVTVATSVDSGNEGPPGGTQTRTLPLSEPDGSTGSSGGTVSVDPEPGSASGLSEEQLARRERSLQTLRDIRKLLFPEEKDDFLQKGGPRTQTAMGAQVLPPQCSTPNPSPTSSSSIPATAASQVPGSDKKVLPRSTDVPITPPVAVGFRGPGEASICGSGQPCGPNHPPFTTDFEAVSLRGASDDVSPEQAAWIRLQHEFFEEKRRRQEGRPSLPSGLENMATGSEGARPPPPPYGKEPPGLLEAFANGLSPGEMLPQTSVQHLGEGATVDGPGGQFGLYGGRGTLGAPPHPHGVYSEPGVQFPGSIPVCEIPPGLMGRCGEGDFGGTGSMGTRYISDGGGFVTKCPPGGPGVSFARFPGAGGAGTLGPLTHSHPHAHPHPHPHAHHGRMTTRVGSGGPLSEMEELAMMNRAGLGPHHPPHPHPPPPPQTPGSLSSGTSPGPRPLTDELVGLGARVDFEIFRGSGGCLSGGGGLSDIDCHSHGPPHSHQPHPHPHLAAHHGDPFGPTRNGDPTRLPLGSNEELIRGAGRPPRLDGIFPSDMALGSGPHFSAETKNLHSHQPPPRLSHLPLDPMSGVLPSTGPRGRGRKAQPPPPVSVVPTTSDLVPAGSSTPGTKTPLQSPGLLRSPSALTPHTAPAPVFSPPTIKSPLHGPVTSGGQTSTASAPPQPPTAPLVSIKSPPGAGQPSHTRSPRASPGTLRSPPGSNPSPGGHWEMQGKPPGPGVSSGIVGVGSGPGICSSGSHKGGKRAKAGGGSAGVVVGHYSQEPGAVSKTLKKVHETGTVNLRSGSSRKPKRFKSDVPFPPQLPGPPISSCGMVIGPGTGVGVGGGHPGPMPPTGPQIVAGLPPPFPGSAPEPPLRENPIAVMMSRMSQFPMPSAVPLYHDAIQTLSSPDDEQGGSPDCPTGGPGGRSPGGGARPPMGGLSRSRPPQPLPPHDPSLLSSHQPPPSLGIMTSVSSMMHGGGNLGGTPTRPVYPSPMMHQIPPDAMLPPPSAASMHHQGGRTPGSHNALQARFPTGAVTDAFGVLGMTRGQPMGDCFPGAGAELLGDPDLQEVMRAGASGLPEFDLSRIIPAEKPSQTLQYFPQVASRASHKHRATFPQFPGPRSMLGNRAAFIITTGGGPIPHELPLARPPLPPLPTDMLLGGLPPPGPTKGGDVTVAAMLPPLAQSMLGGGRGGAGELPAGYGHPGLPY
uniref:B-cell CLL/lymphoma 9 protein-like isoform X2 n=1 Tax=Myxine glutinosa TaxID=7769 RepID=UPI00358EE1D1